MTKSRWPTFIIYFICTIIISILLVRFIILPIDFKGSVLCCKLLVTLTFIDANYRQLNLYEL